MADAQQQDVYREVIQQLHDPWSRRAARQKLVAARATGPLLECLGSTNESVVWAAIQSLGELRATEAVEPLLGLLERGTLTLDVAEALRMITGQDFGIDVKRWRAWAAKPGAPAAGPLSVDSADCIRCTAEYLGVEPAGSKGSYQFRISLADGRSQKVDVYFRRDGADGDELAIIYSVCAPASPKFFEAVLRKNLGIPGGAFAIRDIDGQPHFVMVYTVLASTLTPSTLAKHIENIALRADTVEKTLTKEDRR